MVKGKTVPAFWGKEDWQAIWIGGIVIAIAWLAYRPVLGISLIVIAVALVIFLARGKKKVQTA